MRSCSVLGWVFSVLFNSFKHHCFLNWNHCRCLSTWRNVLHWITSGCPVIILMKSTSYCHSTSVPHLWYPHPSLTLAFCADPSPAENQYPFRVRSRVRLCYWICTAYSGMFSIHDTSRTPTLWKPPVFVEDQVHSFSAYRSAPQLLKNSVPLSATCSPTFEPHIGRQISVTRCLRGASDSRLVFVVNIKEQLKLLL